jgi:Type I phosphodiesterase / nucleotide pyrophosphatase
VREQIADLFAHDLDDLKRSCSRPRRGFTPHDRQSIAAIPELISTVMAEMAHADSKTRLIALAVDGLRYRDAVRGWPNAQVRPCTSVFPTTSIAGWTTSLTGKSVAQHGMAGPVLRDPDTGLTHNLLVEAAHWTPSYTTVFESLLRQGIPSVAILGGLAPYRKSPWLSAMVRGADLARPDDRPATTAVATVHDAFRAISRVLRDRAAAQAVLVWCHIDLDWFVHANGYDDDVVTALSLLDAQATELSDERTAVIAYSDHGLVESEYQPDLTTFWRDLNRKVGATEPGGAGRAAWLYPEPASEDAAMATLERELGGDFDVWFQDQLVTAGLLGHGDAAAARSTMGRIIVVPNGRHYFTLAEPSRFEHGAITESEMFVPVAHWDTATHVQQSPNQSPTIPGSTHG